MRLWLFPWILCVTLATQVMLATQVAHSAQAASAQGAQAGQPKTILDLWDAAYLQGGKSGHVNTLVQETEQNGCKLYRSTLSLSLTVKRFQETIQLRMDTGTTETADGKVTATFLRQYLGQKKLAEVNGTVVGDQLQLVDRAKPLKPAPWDERVVGVYRQQTLFKDKHVKPGDSFAYLSFEPSINLVVNTEVKVKDYEIVELFGGKEKRRLLRVEAKPDKIQNVQLPAMISWLDDNYDTLRSEAEVPGLGRMVLYRTTKQMAMAVGPPAALTDIGIGQYIRLKKRIPRPHDTTSATYRISIKDEDDPVSAFLQDQRQKVVKAGGNSLELTVQAYRGPRLGLERKAPGEEFTKSSYFINSADPLVQQQARTAVGGEQDPWRKALKIERWVNENMRVKNHEALAPADHVAKTLEGDCTEYAMLTAAMCRAVGIPSRTAVGLVYADVRGGPVFAFHMWTEVWVLGQWIPIDATLGRGYVGATHLKITDHSWHEERTLTPLLPVVRVLGRMSIDVLRVE